MDIKSIPPAGDPFTTAPHHDDTVETHYASLERPHACNDGWVSIGQIVLDPETGEEAEEFALYLCRKCAKRS